MQASQRAAAGQCPWSGRVNIERSWSLIDVQMTRISIGWVETDDSWSLHSVAVHAEKMENARKPPVAMVTLPNDQDFVHWSPSQLLGATFSLTQVDDDLRIHILWTCWPSCKVSSYNATSHTQTAQFYVNLTTVLSIVAWCHYSF